jgi:drug/metabolite transporter (DMT)-like permease
MATGPAGRVRPDRITLLALAGVVLFGGGNTLAIKQSLHELAPFWSAGLRFAIAGGLLMVVVTVTRRPFPRGRGFTGAVLYGMLGFVANLVLLYPALRTVPAGVATVLISLAPLVTFGLAILHRQERFRAQGLLGALIAFGGVAVIVADQLSTAVPLGSLLAILLAVTFMAESGVVLKWVPGSDPFATNAVAMLAGASVLLVISAVGGEAWSIPSQAVTWASLGYLVVFGSVVMFGLNLFALRRWTASGVSYVTLLMPLVSVPLAAVLLSERVSPLFLVGGVIALAGVFVGAFLKVTPRLSPAASLPEMLPPDASTEVEPAAPLRAGGPAS